MSRFAQHIGSVAIAIIAIGSVAVAAGQQAKGGFGSDQPQLVRPHLISTQAPAPPSQGLINSRMAPRIAVGPGTLYVETYPTDQQQSSPHMHRTVTSARIDRAPSSLSNVYLRSHGKIVQHNIVQSGSTNVTGINRWWTYQGDNVGGVGRYMANVASGNLVVQADDMSTPHKGIELSFRRTYNSFSQHDYVNSDGSVPSNYGNGWTNTFDAHIAYNDLNGGLGVSVFDIDGARYDYSCPSGPPCSYQAPAGQFAKLSQDQSGDFKWVKKSGTAYWFHDPNAPTPGVAGRLLEIVGRNSNTYLKFAYYFDANHTNSPHLNEIRVVPEWAGQPATATHYVDLQFADYGCGTGCSLRLLYKLTWIDMATSISYNYGPDGHLAEVDEPSDTANSSASIPQWYIIVPGTHLLQQINGGRWALSNGADGSYYQFNYNGNAVTSVKYFGWINPTINDASGNNVVNPSRPTNYGITTPYRTVTYGYSTAVPAPPPPPPGGQCVAPTTASYTEFSDNDGHFMVYCVDATGRLAQQNENSGSTWLTAYDIWDTSNNLISAINNRSAETDYAYDSRGNTIAVAEPAPLPTSGSTARPTTLYSYDQHNNLTAYCDPNWTHLNQLDWTGPPTSSTPCPQILGSPTSPGTIVYSWNSTSADSFGELSSIENRLGYITSFAYNTPQQSPGGAIDYGLPTDAAGGCFTQWHQNGSTCPASHFVYDDQGQAICVSKGSGWTIYLYDLLSRPLASGDPDDATPTVNQSACPKTPGLPNSRLASYRTYYQGGAVRTFQSPSELSAGVVEQYTYDADGNRLTENHFHGAVPTTTFHYYDSDEREVEVVLPHDPSTIQPPFGPPVNADIFSYPLITRYFYDLTSGGMPDVSQLTGSNIAIHGYGNLYAAAIYASAITQPGTVVGPPGWTATKVYSYDALDRITDRYISSGGGYVHSTDSFDATASSLGLLSSTTNFNGSASTTATYTYDKIGRESNVDYAGAAPHLDYVYDFDGRTLSINSSTLGLLTRTFNAEGQQVGETEASGITSPATYTFDYYPNGWREDEIVSASALTGGVSNHHVYRADGLPVQENVNVAGSPYVFSTAYTTGHRVKSTSDPVDASGVSYIYDTYGRTSSYTFPETTFKQFRYDPEGQLQGYSYTTPANESVTLTQNVRGELISATSTSEPGQFLTQSADGALNPFPFTDIPFAASDLTAPGPDDFGNYPSTERYDGQGRHFRSTWQFQYNPCHPGSCFETITGTAGRQFDAQNRLTSINYNNCQNFPNMAPWTRSVGYSWGPNGHPAVFTGSSSLGGSYSETLHWMDDNPVFSTNSAGQVDAIYLGSLGFIAPLASYAGLNVFDRTTDGRTIGVHNLSSGALSYGPWNPPLSRDAHCMEGTGSLGVGVPFTATQGFFDPQPIVSVGPDSVFDSVTSFHGRRNYDQAVGGWSVPDAYDGELHDPMSQRSYMYDGNNSTTYSDPTGFSPIIHESEDEIGGEVAVTSYPTIWHPREDDLADTEGQDELQITQNAGDLKEPANGGYIAGQFGEGRGTPGTPGAHLHAGLDLATTGNATAVTDGTITLKPSDGDWGNVVELIAGAITYVYAHLASTAPNLTSGQSVKAGTVLGVIGNTGCGSCGIHLHFGTLYEGLWVNPTYFHFEPGVIASEQITGPFWLSGPSPDYPHTSTPP